MEEQVLLLKELDIDTWDHFLHYMKLVCSFGKKIIMTDKGIEYATELTNRWKDQEELDEEELNKCFAKFDSKTIEQIQQEYKNDG